MPELPRSRVVPSPCFTATGLDYFGPVKLKGVSLTVKAWVSLFTCLSTRAIHMELVLGLSSAEFLMAFRRFVARRGKPETIVSDNGPQFKLTSSVLNEAWTKIPENTDILDYCANSGIKWTFITEYAPYMGGVYERMIGAVKGCLRKTVGRALLTVKQFETLLCECEAVVNTRPLKFVSSELDSLDVLTPAHFLSPVSKIVAPEGSFGEDSFVFGENTRRSLIEHWTKGQNVLNEFWKLRSSEYLNDLRSRNTYLHRHNSRNPNRPSEGDMVLLKEAVMPRGSWRVAKITQLIVSADGEVRSAKVKLPSGRELKRPVNLLIPFEVQDTTKDPQCTKFEAGSECYPARAKKGMSEADTKAAESDKGIRLTVKCSKPAADESAEEGNELVEDNSTYMIWAKFPGFPYWPALTIPKDQIPSSLQKQKHQGDAVAVRFFESDKIAWISSDNVKDFKAWRSELAKKLVLESSN